MANGSSQCKLLYDEFSLRDDYNKFLEPAQNITIDDRQILHDIVKVADSTVLQPKVSKANFIYVLCIVGKITLHCNLLFW